MLRTRAKRMFLRARGYGLDALELSLPGVPRGADAAAIATSARRCSARAKKSDVPTLYWLGAAWGSAIANAKDDMQLVGELPMVAALMKRALALDESYDEGAIHEFFITYDASQGDGKAAAKKHFERALELSHNKKLSPLVSYAEAVCVDAQDKKEFVRLLEQGVSVRRRLGSRPSAGQHPGAASRALADVADPRPVCGVRGRP